jgi:hypothetical protein
MVNNMGKVISLKPKVRLTDREYNRVQQLRDLSRLSDSAAEIKLFRFEMNSIINKAKIR